jgi:hypothetical protein
MSKKSTIFYHEWLPLINSLPNENKIKLYELIFNINDVELPIINDPHLKSVFDYISNKILNNDSKYKEKCDKARESANARWAKKDDANACETKKRKETHYDNVNDNDNDNDIIKSQDLPKKPKPKYNDFQFQIAEQLGNHVKNIKNINLTIGNIKKWAGDIRLLQEQDLKPRSNSQHDIINAMQSILDNTGKEYFPQIESGSAFRSKFTKIENYKKTTKPTKQDAMKGAFLDFIND